MILVDLRELLSTWPYDPANCVRIFRAAEGREIMQVRMPVGIEQYELEGRPDGQRPYGQESALRHHLDRLAEAQARGSAESFRLTPEECAELFEEGTLYYRRYLHLFQARAWKRTADDTRRNLGLFDFVHRHAVREEDRNHLEQWRPYVLRMNGTALAMLELQAEHHDEALETLNHTINTIQSLQDLDNDTFQFERERSLTTLRDLVQQVKKTRPVSELERLERSLQEAIAAQAFERAAALRDRIRALRLAEQGRV